MTVPALARGITGRHYVWPPNTDKPDIKYPSVTTILQEMAKPGLIAWAAREAATYAVENRDAWVDLDNQGAIDLIKRAPTRRRDSAGNRGSAVHSAIEAWLGNEAPQVNIDHVPYIAGAIQFLDDLVADVLHSEVTIFNDRYQYAGTLDLIAKLKDGRVAVVDWKTSTAVYPEAGLQLVAYANGEWIGHPDGRQEPLPDVELGLVVHLPGDASYTAHEVTLTQRLFRTFCALRTITHFRGYVEADVLGAKHTGKADG